MRRPVFSAMQLGAQEWLKYFAAFDLTVPSIVLVFEISNRYLLRLVYSSPGLSVRPVYSTMRSPRLIASSANTPSPVRERPTLRAKRDSMRRFFLAVFFIAPIKPHRRIPARARLHYPVRMHQLSWCPDSRGIQPTLCPTKSVSSLRVVSGANQMNSGASSRNESASSGRPAATEGAEIGRAHV